jgi:hypothetical protein
MQHLGVDAEFPSNLRDRLARIIYVGDVTLVPTFPTSDFAIVHIIKVSTKSGEDHRPS